ncbi:MULTISPECIES: LysR substrate-binding domain-containing protein [unclassified Streptomyces]|uniref:LysR substrate-binding domain-containing protein n=1 Tax=unclassified Streptomyces TaxID=2593676 RepID=UPI0036DFCAFF
MADGEVDLGLCWSVPDQPGIAGAVLGEFPLAAVVRASDPLASHREVSLSDLRARQILITPSADNPYLDSQLRADVLRAGIPLGHIEEVGRYDELAVHVATRGHVGVHPGPIALTNSLSSVVFRPISDASDSVRICAISRIGHHTGNHTDARAGSIAELIANLRSTVASLNIDDKLT